MPEGGAARAGLSPLQALSAERVTSAKPFRRRRASHFVAARTRRTDRSEQVLRYLCGWSANDLRWRQGGRNRTPSCPLPVRAHVAMGDGAGLAQIVLEMKADLAAC